MIKIRIRKFLSLFLISILLATTAAVFLPPPKEARAASTGPNSPGTMADDASVGTLTWAATVDNAKTQNDTSTTATTASSAQSHYLKATNFSFAIPTNATIDGIVVEVEKFEVGTGTASDTAVRIVKGGTIGSTDRSSGAAWTTDADNDTYTTYGSSTDLWGETWTESDIELSTFGFVFSSLQSGAGIHNVDHIRITVYYTESATTTTIADGTDPGNSSLAPGGSATEVDAFTLATDSGTDTVTAATVTLASGTHAGLSLVEITNSAGSTVYCSETDPADVTVSLTSCAIPVTTSTTTFKVRITPKSHANMPAPAGTTYSVTGTITAFTSTNTQAGTDTDSATVTIDNTSPSNVTSATGTSGSSQNTLGPILHLEEAHPALRVSG